MTKQRPRKWHFLLIMKLIKSCYILQEDTANEKYNLGHSTIKDMTLAELYNPDKPDYTEPSAKMKIGF